LHGDIQRRQRAKSATEALLISPKTLEVNLSRVYRKFGIRSRAEPGRHVGRTDL
jgi:DNA-binding NarL/FixJ family response regulator